MKSYCVSSECKHGAITAAVVTNVTSITGLLTKAGVLFKAANYSNAVVAHLGKVRQGKT